MQYHYWKLSATPSFHLLTPASFEQLKGTLWPKTDIKSDFFPCNCVISSHRIKCNTSIESSQQYVHFIFLHRQAFSNLWGRYDPKNEKNAGFFPFVTVISSHGIKRYSSIKSCHQWLHFTFLRGRVLSNLWRRYEKKLENLMIFNCTLCSLIHLFCSTWLLFKTTN